MPVLEICKILHQRGHEIEFACLENQKKGLEESYPWLSKVYVVGRSITHAEDEDVYRLWDDADLSTAKGRGDVITGFKFFSSFWPETYSRLNDLISKSRPDFIISEVFTEACIDMMNEWNIPIAVYYAQLPVHMAPAKYLPGLPGLQQRCLTSEHATLWDRIYEDIFMVKFIFAAKDLIAFRQQMRKVAAAPPARMLTKPKHLVMVNSFFGLEDPRPLPPLIQPVGPVLPEEWPPLGDIEPFLNAHQKTLYFAFGSHVNLPDWRMAKLIHGITMALDSGVIDGVIWAMKVERTSIDPTEAQIQDSSISLSRKIDYTAILNNRHPQWKVIGWAPQRAILSHPSTRVFLSHCGCSSAMEGLVHGVPFLGMPFYVGDQTGNARRLEASGVGLWIDKHRFTVAEVSLKLQTIVTDSDGLFARNVIRMQRIAVSNLERKHGFAGMIEEVIGDHEMRFEHSPHDRELMPGTEQQVGTFVGVGRELRPMHLQTADARMPWWKASNLDIYLVYAFVFGVCVSFLVLAIVALLYALHSFVPWEVVASGLHVLESKRAAFQI